MHDLPTLPLPGSDEALERGCTCPVMDNAHGKGTGTGDPPDWWVSSDCPLHGTPADEH